MSMLCVVWVWPTRDKACFRDDNLLRAHPVVRSVPETVGFLVSPPRAGSESLESRVVFMGLRGQNPSCRRVMKTFSSLRVTVAGGWKVLGSVMLAGAPPPSNEL